MNEWISMLVVIFNKILTKACKADETLLGVRFWSTLSCVCSAHKSTQKSAQRKKHSKKCSTKHSENAQRKKHAEKCSKKHSEKLYCSMKCSKSVSTQKSI